MDGNFLFLNKRAQKYFDLSPEELTGASAFDFVHPDDRESTKINFFKWLKSKKKKIYFSNRQISAQGEVFDVSWKVLFRYNDSGEILSINCIGKDVSKLKNNKKEMEKVVSQLKERVKELNGLYAITKLTERSNLTIEYFLQSVVDIIPPSFQYPDITCVKVSIDEMIFQTNLFMETKWKLSSPIRVDKKNVGCLNIYYTKEMPISGEGPFLKEERDLTDAICETIGETIEKIQTNKALKEIETRYQILTDQFADGITIIQNDEYKFVNMAFSS
ncbi:MAG: PAS domain S-box protein, partial [archaeon]|nr:PAS domain S-box protein [archaeon]